MQGVRGSISKTLNEGKYDNTGIIHMRETKQKEAALVVRIIGTYGAVSAAILKGENGQGQGTLINGFRRGEKLRLLLAGGVSSLIQGPAFGGVIREREQWKKGGS